MLTTFVDLNPASSISAGIMLRLFLDWAHHVHECPTLDTDGKLAVLDIATFTLVKGMPRLKREELMKLINEADKATEN